MGKLSTHVLDTARGKPAQGVRIDLYRVGEDHRELLRQTVTNHDGRCDEPLLQGNALQKGVYELVFQAVDYFSELGVPAD
jgi:5-hydroxyisourate hydrolase